MPNASGDAPGPNTFSRVGARRDDFDGNMDQRRNDIWPSGNNLLSRVPPEERRILDAHLEPVTLERGQVLYEPGAPLTHVYLPVSGMISLVAVMGDGRTAEVATIGREGAAAMSASGYTDAAFTRYAVHIPGQAFRLPAQAFEDLIDASVMFCSAVTRWREVLVRATLQVVACNLLHHLRQRCARWILTTHDRTESELLPLTQEFLAEMLGVKRNAVNIVARELQAGGLIEYKRGRITVLDREGLKGAACECYGIIHAEVGKMFTDAPSPECWD